MFVCWIGGDIRRRGYDYVNRIERGQKEIDRNQKKPDQL